MLHNVIQFKGCPMAATPRLLPGYSEQREQQSIALLLLTAPVKKAACDYILL